MKVFPDDSRNIVEKMISDYELDLMQKRLGQLGEKCREMLDAWWQGFMDQEIAMEMGYQLGAIVKTSRLGCLEKLRALTENERAMGPGRLRNENLTADTYGPGYNKSLLTDNKWLSADSPKL